MDLNHVFNVWGIHHLSFPLPYTYQSKGKYEVMTGTHKTAAEMVDLYVDLIGKFPSIIAIIDPFRKEVQDSPCIFIIKHRIKSHSFGPVIRYVL